MGEAWDGSGEIVAAEGLLSDRQRRGRVSDLAASEERRGAAACGGGLVRWWRSDVVREEERWWRRFFAEVLGERESGRGFW